MRASKLWILPISAAFILSGCTNAEDTMSQSQDTSQSQSADRSSLDETASEDSASTRSETEKCAAYEVEDLPQELQDAIAEAEAAGDTEFRKVVTQLAGDADCVPESVVEVTQEARALTEEELAAIETELESYEEEKALQEQNTTN